MSDKALTETELLALGRKLRNLRAERGWTQAEVCRRTGLSRPYISQLENGRETPSAAALKELAGVYGTSLDFLLDTAQVVEDEELAPRELRQWATKKQNAVYVKVSKEAADGGLSPEKLRTAVRLLLDGHQSRRS
ncbi:MAG: helix-turn-helix transcriptional regulator [Pseudomonadota bacterium]